MSANKTARAYLSDRRGASAVEFAIVGPIFITVLVGLFIFGWSMHCMSSLRLAVADSARALQINPNLTQAQVKAVVTSVLTKIGDANITLSVTNDTSVAGVTMSKITGTYAFAIAIPLLKSYPVTFQATASVPLSVS